MSAADLLESRARQLYRDGRITRDEYARQVGRIRRVERARGALAVLAAGAAFFLIIGQVFA